MGNDGNRYCWSLFSNKMIVSFSTVIADIFFNLPVNAMKAYARDPETGKKGTPIAQYYKGNKSTLSPRTASMELFPGCECTLDMLICKSQLACVSRPPNINSAPCQ